LDDESFLREHRRQPAAQKTTSTAPAIIKISRIGFMCFQSGEYAHFHTESRSFRHELHESTRIELA